MKEITLPLPELMGIAATRGLLGAGIALMLGDRVEPHRRRQLGAILAAVGLLSTIPFVWDLYHRKN